MKINTLAFILLLCCAIASSNVLALELKEQLLQRDNGSDIHYYVEYHGNRKPRSLIVVIQGSDCNSVARHPTIEEYTEVAPKHAILFVEKYGITNDISWDNEERKDCPIEYLRHNTLEQRVSDYLQVVSDLRRKADWWNGKLVILAGSSGTSVAERVATLLPETERLVIFGFGSRWLADDVLSSVRKSLLEEGLKDDALEHEYKKIVSTFQEVRENPTPNKSLSGHSYAWWASMFKFDQLAALQNVTVPVLAIQGSSDQDTSTAGARDLIEALEVSGHRNITYKEYKGLDHGFVDGSGVSHKAKVIADIRQWLENE